MDHQLKNLLILDIETVSLKSGFSQLSDHLQKHWERKAGFIRNEGELPVEELFFERAGIYAEFGKVIVISVGFYHELESGDIELRVKSYADNDEKKLLTTFKSFLNSKFDQQVLRLCAHNGKEFDFPYLSRRMLINGIKLPEALDLSGKKPKHFKTVESNKIETCSYFSFVMLFSFGKV